MHMYGVKVGDWVGLQEGGGRVSGPYVVRGFQNSDVEIADVSTGRRIIVLASDICAPPRKN